MSGFAAGLPRAVLLALALAILVSGPALAASPSPASGAGGGDPRSSGEGPGLIGDPLTAILVALGIGLLSVVVTYLYIRLTPGRTPQ